MSLTVNMGTWLTLRHEGFGFHISSKGTFLQSQSCGCGFSDTSSSTTSSSIGRCTLGACLAGAAWDGRSPGRKCPFELLHWGGAPGLAWASAGAWSWGRTLDLEAADPPPFAAHAQRTEGRVCPRPVWRFEPETNDAPGGQLSWHNSDPAEVAYHIRQSRATTIGRDESGRFRTAHLKEYPPALCAALAETTWNATCLAPSDESTVLPQPFCTICQKLTLTEFGDYIGPDFVQWSQCCAGRSVNSPSNAAAVNSLYVRREKIYNIILMAQQWKLVPYINRNFRILKWRYASTRFQAIFSWNSPWNLGLKTVGLTKMLGTFNQSVPVEWPLILGISFGFTGGSMGISWQFHWHLIGI